MNKRHYEHTLPNIRGSLSNTYRLPLKKEMKVPSLWEIMVSKYFSVKIYKY